MRPSMNERRDQSEERALRKLVQAPRNEQRYEAVNPGYPLSPNWLHRKRRFATTSGSSGLSENLIVRPIGHWCGADTDRIPLAVSALHGGATGRVVGLSAADCQQTVPSERHHRTGVV